MVLDIDINWYYTMQSIKLTIIISKYHNDLDNYAGKKSLDLQPLVFGEMNLVWEVII